MSGNGIPGGGAADGCAGRRRAESASGSTETPAAGLQDPEIARPYQVRVPGVSENLVRQQPLQARKIAAKALPDLIPSLHALRIGWSEFSKTVVGHRQR